MKFFNRSKREIIILAAFLFAASIINLFLLKLFGQKSSYRAEHSLVGIIMLMGFFCIFANEKISGLKLILLFLISLAPCYLGTVFPDLDIRLMGIGSHRNPLFHSGILFFILFYSARRSHSFFLAAIISGFGIGLGSHLIWDLFDHADVRWIPGGGLDRLWLGINGLLCFILSKTVFDSCR